ncbi:MAG: sulfite exporter TauE/SafE family protein [Elusimicrobia bacterium]|nr:sulfite exporter TauE/SafE family protein [Elusimicrobiota bacterium]
MSELGLQTAGLLAVFGFLIGILGSVMGVGGGVFIVPLLVLWLKVPVHQAIAVSLVAIIATSSAVASVNVERGLANMRLGVVLEMTTALGSIAGALVSNMLPDRVVQVLFSLVLFPVAVMMFLKGLRSGRSALQGHGPAPPARPAGPFDAEFFDPSSSSRTSYAVRRIVPASLLSLLGGSLSGLLGLGGGIIQVPVMNLMCGVPIKAATATSNFLMGVSAAASVLIFFKRGLVVHELAAVIVFGVLLGSFVGMRVLYKAKPEKIQMGFSVLVILVAVRMLAGAWRP